LSAPSQNWQTPDKLKAKAARALRTAHAITDDTVVANLRTVAAEFLDEAEKLERDRLKKEN
jgi:hypothetical protein